MRIQSRKTKLVQVITKEQWAMMKRSKAAYKYDVLDYEDDPTETIEIPKQEIELDIEKTMKKVLESETEEPLSVEEIKEILDMKGIKYHHNLGEERLRKLYEENK